MPLFRLIAEKIIRIDQISMLKEKELENFLDVNLGALFGAHCVIPEHPKNISLLGLDQDNSPLIIQYKKVLNEKNILDGISYINWLSNNKENFNLTVKEIVNAQIEINWIHPRLVFITENFFDAGVVSHYWKNTVIEFWVFNRYKDNLFDLYPIHIIDTVREKESENVKLYEMHEKKINTLPYFFEGNQEREN